MIKTSRNKTLVLTAKEIDTLAVRALKLSKKIPFSEVKDRVVWQDAFKALEKLPDGCVDLMIVDPPYNMTKSFGSSTFREMNIEDYMIWLDSWLEKTLHCLKENASVYICSDWKTSIAVPLAASKYFVLQNRISWEREKGRT